MAYRSLSPNLAGKMVQQNILSLGNVMVCRPVELKYKWKSNSIKQTTRLCRFARKYIFVFSILHTTKPDKVGLLKSV